MAPKAKGASGKSTAGKSAAGKAGKGAKKADRKPSPAKKKVAASSHESGSNAAVSACSSSTADPDVRPYCRRRYPCHWDRKVSRIFGQVARRSPPEARGGLQNGRLWRPC